MKTTIINIVDRVIARQHVCFYTTQVTDNPLTHIRLMEIVEVTYPHPESPEVATIKIIETQDLGVHPKTSMIGSSGVVLEAIQNLTKNSFAK